MFGTEREEQGVVPGQVLPGAPAAEVEIGVFFLQGFARRAVSDQDEPGAGPHPLHFPESAGGEVDVLVGILAVAMLAATLTQTGQLHAVAPPPHPVHEPRHGLGAAVDIRWIGLGNDTYFQGRHLIHTFRCRRSANPAHLQDDPGVLGWNEWRV